MNIWFRQVHIFLGKRLFLTLILISAIFISCGQKDTAPKENITSIDEVTEGYQNWLNYTYENVVIRYPEDLAFKDQLYPIITGFIKYRKQVCDLFQINYPTDTVTIYYHNGFKQLEELTGSMYPTVDSNNIYYSMPYNLGAPMMDYLLTLWHPEGTRHKFLKEGIMTMFDFSGQDYHGMTLNYRDDDKLVSLTYLSEDTTINVYAEKYFSAEAASFIAFVIDTYGMVGLEKLYVSKQPFDKAVFGLFKIKSPQLQERWLKFAEEMYYRQLNNK